MFKTGTAVKSPSSRGLFRDFDGVEPADSLFRTEGLDGAGGTGRFHVSAADDPEERRAERTAGQVVGGGSIFREADGPGARGGEVELPPADLAGPGSALPEGLQQSMGASMGTDFSNVRVHTGAGADRASRRLSARAFARGRDLYFRDGEYDPGSREGQRLIAHELAHVADGADRLHRVYTSKTFPPDANGQPNTDAIRTDVEAICGVINAVDISTLETRYMKGEASQQDYGRLVDARDALGDAELYIGRIDEWINRNGISPENKTSLMTEKGKLESQLQKRQKVIQLSDRMEPAMASDVPMPEQIRSMLQSPYFDQFFRAVTQIKASRKQAADFDELESKAAEQKVDRSSKLSAEDKRNYIQHQNDLHGVSSTGLKKAKDRSSWAGTVGEVMGSAGEAIKNESGHGTAVYTAHQQMEEHGKIAKSGMSEEEQKGAVKKADEKISGKGKGISGIISGAGQGIGAIGAAFGVGQNSKGAAEQREQDIKAKQSMKTIGIQLERTIPTRAGLGQQTADNARSHRVLAICERLKSDQVNDKKVPLSQLISDAMEEDPSLKPELNSKQKSLLSALQVVETSRASSKNQASRLRKEAVFGSMDAFSGALMAAGSITSGAGLLSSSDKAGLAGAILTLAGSVIGKISGIVRGKLIEGAKPEDENAKKMAACRSAIQQMAVLPNMRDKAVEALKKRAGGDTTQNIAGPAMDRAQQYAVVFYTIESANVNMSDLLFAIEKGGFGKETGTNASGQKTYKSAADSLNDMYKNLSFS